MKFNLALFFTISFMSLACTDQSSLIEPPLENTYINTQTTAQAFKVDTSSNKSEKSRPSIFGDLLKKLNLSNQQKDTVNILLSKHKECIENCKKILKSAERTVLINSKIKQDEIRQKLKNGQITNKEASRQLRELKIQTDKELRELISKLKIKDCIITCDNEFITSLREILSQEQILILDRWVAEKIKRS